MVDKLIILDGGGYPFKPPLAVTLMTAPVIRNIYPLITPKFIVANFVKDVYGTKSRVTDETIDLYYNIMMYNGNRKESVKFFQGIKGQMETEAAGVNTIKIPTLIMWGKQDAWIPLSVMERFKNDIPHARTIVYDGVAMCPWKRSRKLRQRTQKCF
jgi:pimeloyl-ACP methyl ester carboxylesterase